MSEPPLFGSQSLMARIRGWFFGALMLFSALFGCFYILVPLLPLLAIRPLSWRRIVDRLIGFWVAMPGGLMEYLFGAKIHVVGDRIEHSEPALIIMNHRTRLDWLFFWNALFRMDPWLLTSEKISLKGILKYVPGAGWAMSANGFLFLDRSFANDQQKFDTMIEYYANSGFQYQLLLFPEGTDKCPRATERSRLHAEKNGLVHYEYVLHPRTTGFVYVLQRMRKAGYIRYVYDVTVAYTDVIVQSEVDLVVQGACPKDVHYQVVKINVEELPEGDEELAEWLNKLWAEKEQKLRLFHAPADPAKKRFDSTPHGSFFEYSSSLKWLQLGIVAFWMSLSFAWFAGFALLPGQLLYGALCSALFLYALKYYGGIEWVMIERFNSFYQDRKVPSE